MSELTYSIVEHDGGWAYKVGDTFSETFQTHAAAVAAAQRAAGEQRVGGAPEGIRYEDSQGRWHDEIVQGGDRPETVVKDEK